MSQPLFPLLEGMSRDEIDVLAAMARCTVPEGEPDPFEHMSNAALASTLIDLQAKGFITLIIDEDDNPGIQINRDPSAARREYEQRKKPKRESKIKRRKRRPW